MSARVPSFTHIQTGSTKHLERGRESTESGTRGSLLMAVILTTSFDCQPCEHDEGCGRKMYVSPSILCGGFRVASKTKIGLRVLCRYNFCLPSLRSSSTSNLRKHRPKNAVVSCPCHHTISRSAMNQNLSLTPSQWYTSLKRPCLQLEWNACRPARRSYITSCQLATSTTCIGL